MKKHLQGRRESLQDSSIDTVVVFNIYVVKHEIHAKSTLEKRGTNGTMTPLKGLKSTKQPMIPQKELKDTRRLMILQKDQNNIRRNKERKWRKRQGNKR